MEGFMQRQIRDAATARKFQNTAGLATTGVISVVDKKMLNNSPKGVNKTCTQHMGSECSQP